MMQLLGQGLSMMVGAVSSHDCVIMLLLQHLPFPDFQCPCWRSQPAFPAHHSLELFGARTETFRLGITHCMIFPICTTQFRSRVSLLAQAHPRGRGGSAAQMTVR